MTLSLVAVKTVYKSLFRNAACTERHLLRGKRWFIVEEELKPFTKFAPDIQHTFHFGNHCLTSLVRSEFKKHLHETKPGKLEKLYDTAFDALKISSNKLLSLEKNPLCIYSEAITQGVKVCVESFFVIDNSPTNQYGYRVVITNTHPTRTVQLSERHWKVRDANGNLQEVIGPGVIGKHPILLPSESFTYQSSVRIPTYNGVMEGSYTMIDLSTGEKFKAVVAPFSLHVPVDVAARIKEKGSKREAIINWEELVHARSLSPLPYASIRTAQLLDDNTNTTTTSNENTPENNQSDTSQKPETPSEPNEPRL